MKAIPTGVYVDTSALDECLYGPQAGGSGPFVLSEYTLAEKARLPWDQFQRLVDALSNSGVLLLQVPPVTQLITGNLDPAWSGAYEYVPIDVAAVRDGRATAVRRLDEICEMFETQFAQRYAALRPHMAEWKKSVDGGNPGELLDPRKPEARRGVVLAATLDSLGRSAPPQVQDPASERLRFTLRAWEMAMAFVRLDRERDDAKDLRNDPIDGVHYALAATFCSGLATRDRDIARIRDLMPEPRCPLRVLP